MKNDQAAEQLFDRPVYKSSTQRLAEPYIAEVEEVFTRLQALLPATEKSPAPIGPSLETIAWATDVLLHVLPRKLLIGAKVDAFEREIHVSWENDATGKRVVVFFPEQHDLKIYHERVENDVVSEHDLVTVPQNQYSLLSEKLRWFFQPLNASI